MPPVSDDSESLEIEDCAYEIRYVAYCYVAPIIVTVGIVGNVLNLLVLSRPNIEGVTYTYLRTLATVDLANMLFAIPTIISFIKPGPLPYSTVFFFAHFELLIANSLLATSVYIVLAVTVDRYLCVAYPTRFIDFHNNRQVCKVLVTSCLLAVVINLPFCWYYEVREVPKTENVTEYNCTHLEPGFYKGINKEVIGENWWTPYIIIQQLMLRIFPAIAIVTLNCLLLTMFRRVIGRRKKLIGRSAVSADNEFASNSNLHVATPQPTAVSALAQEETRLVIVLTVFSVIVLGALTPAALVYFLIADARLAGDNVQLFRVISNNLEYLNSALNFYLYCMTCKKIRQNMSTLFCGWTFKPRLLQHTVTPDKLQLNRQTSARPYEIVD